MIKLTVPEALLDRNKLSKSEIGSFSVMVNTPKIAENLWSIYGRRNLALKVLKVKDDRENPRWGKTLLFHATIIQNLFAREGLAPRVFGWISVNGCLAQVTEYLKKSPPQDHRVRIQKLVALMDRYNLVSVAKNLDAGVRNWRGDKFVDFSHIQFRHYDAYVASLDIRARTRRGKLLGRAYQPVPGLNIEGTRNIPKRIENLRLCDIDWKGRYVLDVGCSFGAFSRYAHDAGAKRVYGVDKNGELAFEINNVLRYWNMDFITGRLPGKIKLPKANIAFMMAFHNYVGGLEAALSFVSPVVNNLLILESHGGEKREDYEPILAKYFPRVDYLGYIADPKIRHQWHCWK